MRRRGRRRELLAVTHDYPERSVELHFFACTLTGEPRPLLGQEMRWVARDASCGRWSFRRPTTS